jgi:adenylate cyclase
MAKEIERKFLVDRRHDEIESLTSTPGMEIKQGYIASNDTGVVRVRTMDDQAFLTIKGATSGITRSEYEYEIPKRDAEEMLSTLCGSALEKKRWLFPLEGGLTVEVDYFPQIDLMIAEVELASEDQVFDKPEWLLEDVSSCPEYYNNKIAARISSEDRLGLAMKSE